MHKLNQTLAAFLLAAATAFADNAATFFDDSTVKEIRLNFDDTNWYNTLLAGHRTTADPYYPCRFESGSVTIARIGCRFKGNSSFNRNGIKKPFKLDFNEYDDNATFLGLKKLNLNNFDLSPDFMREKLLHDMANKYVTAMRSTYVRLYVNNNFYGLYLAVEQPDKTMMESRFGDKEDGNLYEAESSQCDLSYLGADPASYRTRYLLETNETANDYSGLIEFLNILNNTAAADLQARLEAVADGEDWMTWMALNNIVVNLDSYIGTAAEYFMYDRAKDGRFIHIQWDHNESFGITGDGTPRLTTPATTDPFYITGNRPLLTKMWAAPGYRRVYLQAMARALREHFNPTYLNARIDQLAAMIRPHVAEDPNKAYTLAQFDTNLTSTVSNIPGLKEFIAARYTFLRNYLNNQTASSEVRLNKVGNGAVELLNLGPSPLALNNYSLTDDPATPNKWPIAVTTLADGATLTIPVTLSSSGGRLYLFNTTQVDSVTYPAIATGQTYVRTALLGSTWQLNGAETQPTGTGQLKINEVMADTKVTSDWFEIYNPGTTAVDMTGMYLTDSATNPTKYKIPSGISVPAKGYVVFWADNDTAKGANHTNFALDADGERVLLYGTDGATLIDGIIFSSQQEEISYGRETDGADGWTIFSPSTPGATNTNPMARWIINSASARSGPIAPGSIVSAYNTDGASIRILDSAGVTHNASLFFTSASQVNFLMPATVATGRATVTFTRQNGSTATGAVLVTRSAPGIFTTTANGEGAAVLAAIRVTSTNQQSIATQPLDLTTTDNYYLTIYATGLRNETTLSKVKAQIGDIDVPVLYAGAQSEFPGLDQLNIGPVPKSLAGKGTVVIELTVDGMRANRVELTVK